MEEICMLILVLLFATNSLEKAESVKVKLEETPHKTFDEIFGEGWWDKEEAEELKTPPTNFGHAHHQIDRQNTQIGQPNSNDLNPPLTESDHPDNAKNGENIAEDERKRKIVEEFHAMKDEFKQKGKFSKKEWVLIEQKIAKHLKVSRSKIFEWKKEFGLTQRNPKNERKNLVEKFDQMKAELKRDGFKKSYKNEINKTVAKELGLNDRTIYKWKRKLGQTTPNKYSQNEQNELMNCYYKIKNQNPKISDEEIAKMLKIGRITLVRWKKQFKRQKFHPNSVDGHSVEENAAGAMFRKLGTPIRRISE